MTIPMLSPEELHILGMFYVKVDGFTLSEMGVWWQKDMEAASRLETAGYINSRLGASYVITKKGRALYELQKGIDAPESDEEPAQKPKFRETRHDGKPCAVWGSW